MHVVFFRDVFRQLWRPTDARKTNNNSNNNNSPFVGIVMKNGTLPKYVSQLEKTRVQKLKVIPVDSKLVPRISKELIHCCCFLLSIQVRSNLAGGSYNNLVQLAEQNK